MIDTLTNAMNDLLGVIYTGSLPITFISVTPQLVVVGEFFTVIPMKFP